MILNETGFQKGTPIGIRMKYIEHSVVGAGKWGTTLLLRDNVTKSMIYQSQADDPFECIMIRIVVGGKRTTLVGGYWPPRYIPKIDEWREILSKGSAPYLVLGDFNAHHEQGWGSNYTDQKGRLWAQLMDEFDLQMHGEGDTCFRPRVRPSNVDIGLTSSELGACWERKIGADPMG